MTRDRNLDPDRRRDQRVTGTGMRAQVRPGYRLVVIDLSSRGALVEAGRPLRPGSHVDLQLETDARRGTVAARVVRCAVAAIDAESRITYRAALCFTECCDWVREAMPPTGYGVPQGTTGSSSSAPFSGDPLPAAHDQHARRPAKGAK